MELQTRTVSGHPVLKIPTEHDGKLVVVFDKTGKLSHGIEVGSDNAPIHSFVPYDMAIHIIRGLCNWRLSDK